MSESRIPSDDATDRRETPSPDGRRQSVVDRRTGLDLRESGDPERRAGIDRRDITERRDDTGLRRLRGPGRRRPEFNRSAEEGEFTSEQFLFVMAIQAFKNANGKTFPTWTEVLEVVRRLGYRKTAASELNLPNAEDWTEQPDTPAMPPKPEPWDADQEQ